ncbi:MAG: hypothetical protein R2778_08535 [Saprospiraceae bacterium]
MFTVEIDVLLAGRGVTPLVYCHPFAFYVGADVLHTVYALATGQVNQVSVYEEVRVRAIRDGPGLQQRYPVRHSR